MEGRCPRRTSAPSELAPFGATTVPADSAYLLGDNRSVAVDSRQVGAVALGDITGVAVRITAPGDVVRAVPGAPTHEAPAGEDVTDPADTVPTSATD